MLTHIDRIDVHRRVASNLVVWFPHHWDVPGGYVRRIDEDPLFLASHKAVEGIVCVLVHQTEGD